MKLLRELFTYFTASYKPVFFIYCLVILAISIQQLMLPGKAMEPDGALYTEYNNYVIFKQAYFHLVNQKDLYSLYLSEQWDLFKYSPAFALFFGTLAYLPDGVGLVFWNLLNAFCLFIAIKSLPHVTDKAKIAILFFVLLELVTSLQNSQSNALMVGLLLLAFIFFENDRVFFACLCITLTVFIKLFGLLAFAMAIFYPQKIKAIFYSIGCFLFLGIIPLLVVPADQLIFLYKSWWGLLINDHTVSYGLSMLGWLISWFGFSGNKNVVVLVGLTLLLVPLVRVKEYKSYLFRVFYLGLLLIWMVLFNHKAESPTFIIAISGVAVWYFIKPINSFDRILLVIAFVFTCLSPTDIFPSYIQNQYFDPYVIKAVPCILVWFKITFDLLFSRFHNPLFNEQSKSSIS